MNVNKVNIKILLQYKILIFNTDIVTESDIVRYSQLQVNPNIRLLINQMLIFLNRQALLASLANCAVDRFRNCFQVVEDGSDEFSLGNNNFKVKYNFHFTLNNPNSRGIIAIKRGSFLIE